MYEISRSPARLYPLSKGKTDGPTDGPTDRPMDGNTLEFWLTTKKEKREQPVCWMTSTTSFPRSHFPKS